jgi:hypothetical protein
MLRLSLTTAFVCFLSVCLRADETSTSELDEVAKKYTAAFNNHDPDALSKFYAKKTDVIHGDNVPRKSRREMRDAFAAYFKENPDVKASYTEIVRTTLTPKIVIESGVWQDSGVAGGKTERGRYSAVFKKVNGTWLTIYERGWKTPDSTTSESK